jgi:hypothetical protein
MIGGWQVGEPVMHSVTVAVTTYVMLDYILTYLSTLRR